VKNFAILSIDFVGSNKSQVVDRQLPKCLICSAIRTGVGRQYVGCK